MKIPAIVFLVLLLLCLQQCNDNTSSIQNGSVSFALTIDQPDAGRVNNDQTPSFALVTIKDNNGNLIVDKLLDLFQLGAEYMSENVVLNTGQYQLSQFLILNSDKKVMYACPTENSSYGQYVADPLPILFNVTAQSTTHLIPQVIAVSSTDTPTSFGYVDFGFEVVTIEEEKLFVKVVDDQLYDSVELVMKHGNVVVKKTIKEGETSFEIVKGELLGVTDWNVAISAFRHYEYPYQDGQQHYYERKISGQVDISSQNEVVVLVDDMIMKTDPVTLAFPINIVNYLHFYIPEYFHFVLNADTPCDPYFTYQLSSDYTYLYADKYLHKLDYSSTVYYSYVEAFSPFNFSETIDATATFSNVSNVCANFPSAFGDVFIYAEFSDGTNSGCYYAWGSPQDGGRLKGISEDAYRDMIIQRKRMK